jgi:hypothetical protein
MVILVDSKREFEVDCDCKLGKLYAKWISRIAIYNVKAGDWQAYI